MIHEYVVILKPDMVKVAETARVDSFVKIEGGGGVQIGEHVHIASFSHINIGGGITILDKGSAVSSGAKILGGSNDKDSISMSAVAPAEQQNVKRDITRIGINAFVGTNAVIMPGVFVGPGAVIGAGAVVTRNVPAYEIWAGVPARRIGMRPRPEEL